MASPTRFPIGVTNAYPGSNTGMYGLPDPTSWHSYFDDFDYFSASNWVITTVETGTGNATEALTDADGGVLLITNDDADDDSDFFNKVGESFLMEAGKPAVFKCRFKVSDATESALVFGLQVTDTTPLDATDGIYFTKADGSTTVTAVCRKNATTGSTSLNAATLASDTYIVLGWYYDGKSSVQVFVNDEQIGTLDGSSSYLPDTELTISFGIENGSAGAKTMSVDYILAAKRR
jgi:hypothetical protein